MNETTISPDRSYLCVTEATQSGFKFHQITLPEQLENSTIIAANLFVQQYLAQIPLDQAGRLIAAIPIETVRSSQTLQQIFAPPS